MSISPPYSIELGANEDAQDVVEDTTITVVADKMKIFIGSAVLIHKRQSVFGSLQAIYEYSKNYVRLPGATGNFYVHGTFDSCTENQIIVDTAAGGISTSHVSLVFPADFAYGSSSGLFKETFDQLMQVLLEKSKDN